MSEFSDFMSSAFREVATIISPSGMPVTLQFGDAVISGTIGILKSGREMRNAGIIPTFDEEFNCLLEDFTQLGLKHENQVTIGGRMLRVKDISYHGVFVILGLKEVR